MTTEGDSVKNIALTGKARAGKDTVADVLVKEYGYRRIAFADPLKAMALEIDPYTEEADWYDGGKLSELVDFYGWERTKDQWPDVRRFLQQLGSSIRKRDEMFWINAALTSLDQAYRDKVPVVVTDCRYENEAEALRNLYFSIVRIVRPGIDSSDTHESETEMDGYEVDSEIINAGTITGLRNRVRAKVSFMTD